jgi:hypothetical protein
LSTNAIEDYGSLVEQDSDWSIRLTAAIGQRVAQFRERKAETGKKMTVQALADRCAALGLPIGRVTITKLERGLRQAITPGEVFVLAAALEVSPIDLLLPVGHQETIEILPGARTTALDAVRWIAGDFSLRMDADGRLRLDQDGNPILGRPDPGGESDASLVRRHSILLHNWYSAAADADVALMTAARGLDEDQGEQARTSHEAAEHYKATIVYSMWQVRAEMRRRHMHLPELPRDLEAFLERGGPDDEF